MMRRRSVLQGLAAAGLAMPAIAQPARTATLRFVPQPSLPTLDPMFSSEVVTSHGFHVYDTLSPPADGREAQRGLLGRPLVCQATMRVWLMARFRWAMRENTSRAMGRLRQQVASSLEWPSALRLAA